MTEAEAWGVFDGVMASDGSLCLPRGADNAYFEVDVSGSEHDDWLDLIKEALIRIGGGVSPAYPRRYIRVSRGKPYIDTRLCSRCSSTMTTQRQRWYPNGKKAIPSNLQLTPIVLANWFAGDGSSFRNKEWSKGVQTFFHTQCFDYGNIERFEQSLHSLGIGTGRGHDRVLSGAGIKVLIKQSSVDKLMSMIEPHMVPSFLYKVKYRTNHQQEDGN